MTNPTILVIRPVTSLGVSQLRVFERAADGSEVKLAAATGKDPAPATAVVAARAAAEPPCPGVLIDLEFCDWVDSTGLGVWVSWHLLLEPKGGRVVVCRANSRVTNVLKVAQLDQLFTLCATLEGGIAALAGSGS